MSESLSPDARLLLSYIAEHPGTHEAYFVRDTGLSFNSMMDALSELRKSKLIKQHRLDETAGTIVYYLR